jgi:hypothetical protein
LFKAMGGGNISPWHKQHKELIAMIIMWQTNNSIRGGPDLGEYLWTNNTTSNMMN